MHAAKSQQTQIAGIEAYLRSGKALTPAEALTNFSCFRLAARVKELKDKKGMAIITTIKENPVSGNRYASYTLDKSVLAVGERVVVVSIEASLKEGLTHHDGEFYSKGDKGVVTEVSAHGSTQVQFDIPKGLGKHREVGGQWYIATKDLKRA